MFYAIPHIAQMARAKLANLLRPAMASQQIPVPKVLPPPLEETMAAWVRRSVGVWAPPLSSATVSRPVGDEWQLLVQPTTLRAWLRDGSLPSHWMAAVRNVIDPVVLAQSTCPLPEGRVLLTLPVIHCVEAARILGIKARTLRELSQRSRLTRVWPGSNFYPREQVLALAAHRRAGGRRRPA